MPRPLREDEQEYGKWEYRRFDHPTEAIALCIPHVGLPYRGWTEPEWIVTLARTIAEENRHEMVGR